QLGREEALNAVDVGYIEAQRVGVTPKAHHRLPPRADRIVELRMKIRMHLGFGGKRDSRQTRRHDERRHHSAPLHDRRPRKALGTAPATITALDEYRASR